MDETPPDLDALGHEKGLIEIPIGTIRSFELKKPGTWYGQGFVRFATTDGKDVKLGLLGGSGDYFGEFGSEVCEKLAVLLEGRLPRLVSSQ